MNSGGTQKKHMSGLFYLFFFHMGSGHEILEVHRCSMGEAAAICSRSMISFLSSTTGHG